MVMFKIKQNFSIAHMWIKKINKNGIAKYDEKCCQLGPEMGTKVNPVEK